MWRQVKIPLVIWNSNEDASTQGLQNLDAQAALKHQKSFLLTVKRSETLLFMQRKFSLKPGAGQMTRRTVLCSKIKNHIIHYFGFNIPRSYTVESINIP